MGTVKYGLIGEWKSLLVLILAVVYSTALLTSCSKTKPDQRTAVLENQTKILMILEAQQGFKDLFKKAFNPDQTKLLVGTDLQKWFQDNHRSYDSLPEPLRTSIKNNQGAGLLISGALPGKSGGNHDVVYMRAPRFGGIRYFFNDDPDPCGDGNPATCDNCTGCSEESEPGGTIHTCVCTQSCDVCRACPPC